MGWLRVLPLIVVGVLLLGLLFWLVESLLRLYSAVAWWSPLLANLVLLLLIILLVAVLAVGGYYGWLFLRPRRRRPQPRPPRDSKAAAQATLTAVQQQMEQLQSEVARQALQQRSQTLVAALERRDVQIAVFGVGSVGKTSLVNAFARDLAGAVGAAMGTTAAAVSYRLRLAGLPRGIQLIDTPGLLEAGALGEGRELAARELAATADLLLFVVANDLQQSEAQLLRSLRAMGKRVLLVINKADLYPVEDLEQIEARVRSQLDDVLAPQDVITIAANPAPVRLTSGEWVHPAPDIDALLTRLAQVLRQEGDTLVADNLLLQSQQLQQEAQRLIEAQRQQQADAIVDRYQWIGAGVIAVTPLPGLDLLATAAVNAQMVVELGRVYGCHLSLEEGKALALSLAKTLTGLGIVKGTMELLALGLQSNLATVLAGRAPAGGERRLPDPHRRQEFHRIFSPAAGLGRWRHGRGSAAAVPAESAPGLPAAVCPRCDRNGGASSR
ncbi:GTP-binding protein [Halomicronema hongdechloris C2206]|uniref:GTP-binding protein n=1 Tax=Halomicronema hongdechloris C2206 TaxID=1641165 RepID=A0A1Z3HMY5_9CYAN|nr:GTP-binding protein [Halomicronema hongdechloris]ASC71673.1 GTP-binding protein [Halomicronema hongdechloris C2206]